MTAKRIDGLQVAAVSTASQPSTRWSQSEEAFEKSNYEQQPEQVQYMHNTSSSSQTEFHGDTYNPSWRNYPNLRWGDNQNSWQKNHNSNNSRNTNNQNHSSNNTNQYRKPQNSYHQPNNNSQIHQNNFSTPPFNPQNNHLNNPNNFQQQPSYSNIPSIDHQETRISTLEATLQALAQTTQSLAKGQKSLIKGQQHQEATMRNLERQVGQLARQAERPTNVFPSDTILNPKEECKAIQVRSGKTLENDKGASQKQVEEDKHDQDKLKEKKEETQASKKGKQVMEEHPQEQRKVVRPYIPPLPYPQRLQRELKDQQFPKFLEIFKKLEINIPLAEALEQMPLALCDLGSSINLIPLSMMRMLSIEEVKPTRITLQLADRSMVIPNGVVENLLVKVGKFIFLTDFVILDLDEERGNSIILGRPFLATARAIIDVEKGEMTMRSHDEKITLNIFKEMQHPAKKKGCMRIEEEDSNWKEKPKEVLINSPLEQKTDIEEKQKVHKDKKAEKGLQKEVKKAPDIKPVAKKEGWMEVKEVILEIGFRLKEGEYLIIRRIILQRRWKLLCEPLTDISATMIREFYANAIRASQTSPPYKSYVRGVDVDFSPSAIMRVLQIRVIPFGESSFDE
nr:uncharacterized protein DDB_G0292186-like [Arachis hypogaea]